MANDELDNDASPPSSSDKEVEEQKEETGSVNVETDNASNQPDPDPVDEDRLSKDEEQGLQYDIYLFLFSLCNRVEYF